MPGKTKIKTRCPTCGTSYRVPADAVNHHARCAKCRTKFRVQPVRPDEPPRPPTEDDVLRWLNEGLDEETIASRPRVIHTSDVAPGVPAATADAETPKKESANARRDRTSSSPPSATTAQSRTANVDPSGQPTFLRKTG